MKKMSIAAAEIEILLLLPTAAEWEQISPASYPCEFAIILENWKISRQTLALPNSEETFKFGVLMGNCILITLVEACWQHVYSESPHPGRFVILRYCGG
jgi:hypothetical protein